MVAGWFQDRKCVKIIVGQHQKGTLRVSTSDPIRHLFS